MPRLIKKGSTDVVDYVFIRDSTDDSPETGITVTVLDMQYTRELSSPAAKVDAIVSDASLTTHVDNKIVEVDGVSSPGLYMVCWPDAVFATGVKMVTLTVIGTGYKPVHKEIQLVDFDPEDTVRLGLTALPNAPADAAGGLPISDAGGLELDVQLANTNQITAARMGALTDWIDGGRLDLLLDLIKVLTDRQEELMVAGTAQTGTLTTTMMSTDLTPTILSQYNGRIITFRKDTTSAGLRGLQTNITATAVNGDLTYSTIPIAPADGDTFEIT